MYTIWRFENDILEACGNLLQDAQKLLQCDFEYEIVMVAAERSSHAILLSSTSDFLTAEEIQVNTEKFPEFPKYPDSELSEQDWKTAYLAYDAQCWSWWNVLRFAIQDACDDKGLITTVSPCVEINNCMVALVAIVPSEQLMKYPSLPLSAFLDHGRWPSLQFGIIEAVLNQFAEELRKRNPGQFEDYRPFEASQVVRTAGEFFARIHGWAGKRFSHFDLVMRGTLSLFDACNVIASSGYERREGFGGMILADAGHPGIDVTLGYKLPILLNDYRRMRKLLEMCNSGLSILSDSRYAFGLGRFDRERYDQSKMDVFSIRFEGHYRWTLSHLDTVLMNVEYGNPSLPQAAEPHEKLQEVLHDKFRDSTELNRDAICRVVALAVKASHGAVVVISSNAAKESQRLAGDRGIVPFASNDDAMTGALAVDGAVMIDLQGTCHGIGLILDGIAGQHENPGRGARYNSVRRYLHSHSDCVVVVVSEDGMINVFPDHSEKPEDLLPW